MFRTLCRPLGVLSSAALLTTALAAPVHADPVPPEARLAVIGWSEGAIMGDAAGVLGLQLSSAPDGTSITGTMTSCGRPVEQALGGVYQGRGFASFDLFEDNANLPTQYPPSDDPVIVGVSPRLTVAQLVGPSYDYSLTVTQPGYDPYVVTGTQPLHTVRRPSCAAIDETVRRTIHVLSWSQIQGTARVGQTVTASRPVTEGASSIRYRWTSGRRVVGRHSKLRLTRAMRHTYVALRVSIRQPGKTLQREDLALPKGVR